MLWTIISIILIIWLIGLVLEIAGGLIHLLLVIAGIIFIYQLLTGKRSL
ncbi:putative membrane protein [Alkalibacillus filiformis]|uniref:Membrane protein n=1 Tax=Alkalibacillus filiformis TaxID=200990 RepID=A0ABU0DQR7_9BACI|nr:lmo0937 family membrane protein [Alkalibacillus filiformis]MDQ0350793.1 putative membrane protein [Alkalibacillus filiformis]